MAIDMANSALAIMVRDIGKLSGTRNMVNASASINVADKKRMTKYAIGIMGCRGCRACGRA